MIGVTSSQQPCAYCGGYHQAVCPMVKAIDYYPDGTVKRVELKTPADYHSEPRIDWLKPPWDVTCGEKK